MCGRVRLSSDVSEIEAGLLDPTASAHAQLSAERAVNPRVGKINNNDPSLIEPIPGVG